MTLETEFFSTETSDFPKQIIFSSHELQCFMATKRKANVLILARGKRTCNDSLFLAHGLLSTQVWIEIAENVFFE